MKIKYFSDTDTALIEFSDLDVAETREINENIYIDLDSAGNLIAMTIEHAREQANLPFLSFEQFDEESHNKKMLPIRSSESKLSPDRAAEPPPR